MYIIQLQAAITMDSGHSPSEFRDSNSHVVQDIPNETSEFKELVTRRIEERKAKTDEKRKETLRSLENKILRNEYEPGANMFGFPDLVWSMEILPLLYDRRDVWNMWEVHPTFRQLSGSSLTNECLLSQVLKIENLPHLWKSNRKGISQLIALREISKSMRTTIDGIFEEHFVKVLRRPIPFIWYHRHPQTTIFVIHHPFTDLNRILEAFCEGSVDKRAKRICGHSLHLIWLPDGVTGDESFLLELERKTRLLLEHIGDQVWYFKFVVDFCKIPAENVYLYFRLWLSCMPNLKWVLLDVLMGDKIDRTVMQDNPLPRLNHLERVTLRRISPVQIQCALASAVIGPNIETIRAIEFHKRIRGGDDNALHFLNEMMPLLYTLKLDMVTGLKMWTPPTLEILKPVATSRWMLTKVWHYFGYVDKCPSLRMIFSFLNSILTLEQIYLNNVNNVVIGDAVPPLRLPNLVDFKMTFDISSVSYENEEDILFFTSLQFLVQSKKLKTLEWSFSARKLESVRKFKEFLVETGEKEMINFKSGLQKDLSRSNLWQVFPELEFLKTSVALDDGKEGRPLVIRKPRHFMM